MNCKQGDLAYTVGMIVPENNGRIVKVLRPGDSVSDDYFQGRPGAVWICESAGTALVLNTVNGCPLGHSMQRAISDDLLRPIRPQSDDAVDTHSLRQPEKVPA